MPSAYELTVCLLCLRKVHEVNDGYLKVTGGQHQCSCRTVAQCEAKEGANPLGMIVCTVAYIVEGGGI